MDDNTSSFNSFTLRTGMKKSILFLYFKSKISFSIFLNLEVKSSFKETLSSLGVHVCVFCGMNGNKCLTIKSNGVSVSLFKAENNARSGSIFELVTCKLPQKMNLKLNQNNCEILLVLATFLNDRGFDFLFQYIKSKVKEIYKKLNKETNENDTKTRRNKLYVHSALIFIHLLIYALRHKQWPTTLGENNSEVKFNNFTPVDPSRTKKNFKSKGIEWDYEDIKLIITHSETLARFATHEYMVIQTRLKQLERKKSKNEKKTKVESIKKKMMKQEKIKKYRIFSKFYRSFLLCLDNQAVARVLNGFYYEKENNFMVLPVFEELLVYIFKNWGKYFYSEIEYNQKYKWIENLIKQKKFTRVIVNDISELASLILEKKIERKEEILKFEFLTPSDFGLFNSTGKNLFKIFYHTAYHDLKFQLEEYKGKKIILFKTPTSSNFEFGVFDYFDKQEKFSNWYDRLNNPIIREFSVLKKYPIITVKEISRVDVFFSKFNVTKDASFQYIKTSGHGVGTYFISSGKSLPKRQSKVNENSFIPKWNWQHENYPNHISRRPDCIDHQKEKEDAINWCTVR